MGLGSVKTFSLAEARELARDCRKLAKAGIDPIEERKEGRVLAALEAANAMTFREAAEKYIDIQKLGWRNEKHAKQCSSTLAAYAYPIIGSVPVQLIDVAMVMRIVEPIWASKTETASRVRGRIESILDWATAHGYRTGENPARWRGHMAKMLPERSKVQSVEHYPALPYTDIGEFVVSLRAQNGSAARALEFLILTVSRTNEVLQAVPGEFDMEDGLWVIPGDRMKSGREHRVPLTERTLEILTEFMGVDKFVFMGGKRGKPLSNAALMALLKRMDYLDITVHGFRSTFRDWAAEQTNYSREVVEMALAHSILDKTEAAYRRGDLLEKRKRLLADWEQYCLRPPQTGNVIQLAKLYLSNLHAPILKR